jgi:hypothetical protein
MLEVGLDGTIYNYHSHRKDSFTESTDRFMARKFKCMSADAANSAFSAIREAAENGFQPGRQYRRKERCVGMNCQHLWETENMIPISSVFHVILLRSNSLMNH